MNEDLLKEANFFGDIVIVPFIDSYDLVVLKTVAICDYAVCSSASRHGGYEINLSCKYLKCISWQFLYIALSELHFPLFEGSCCSCKVCYEVR